MSRMYHCDLCGESFGRTYVDKGYHNRVEDGYGSGRVERSLRRRIIRWLFGAPIVLKLYKSGRYRWHKQDVCRECMNELMEELR